MADLSASTTDDNEQPLAEGFFSDCTETPSTSAASSTVGDADDDNTENDEENKAYLKTKHGIRPKPSRPAYYFYTLKHGGHNRALHDKWTELETSRREPYEAKASADHERYHSELANYSISLDLDISYPSTPTNDLNNPSTSNADPESPYDSDDEACCEQNLSNARSKQRWYRYRADHASYNKLVTPPHPVEIPTPFRFLDLPIELRTNIYTLLLTSPNPLTFNLYDSSPHPFDTRLLVVNHQMHHEALREFYSSNTFKISAGIANNYEFHEPFMTKNSGTSTPFPTTLIRRWKIQIFYNPTSEDPEHTLPKMTAQIQLLASILKPCKKLDTINITSIRQAPYDFMTGLSGYMRRDRYIDGIFDPLWDILGEVRGVGEVRFTDPKEEFYALGLVEHTDLGSVEKRMEVKKLMESSRA